METILRNIQYVAALVGAIAGEFVGGFDGMIRALIVFVIADYVMGVMCAIREKNLSSHAGFQGILRKVGIFVLVGIANELDIFMPGSDHMLRTAVIFFYVANEGVSLLENASRLGLPVPDKLQKILTQIKDK